MSFTPQHSTLIVSLSLVLLGLSACASNQRYTIESFAHPSRTLGSAQIEAIDAGASLLTIFLEPGALPNPQSMPNPQSISQQHPAVVAWIKPHGHAPLCLGKLHRDLKSGAWYLSKTTVYRNFDLWISVPLNKSDASARRLSGRVRVHAP